MVFYLKLFLVLLLVTGCGTQLHDREGLDPVSEPKYAVSDGGMKLTAVKGKQRGICVLRSFSGAPRIQLVTERGALSDKALKSAFGYMGVGESITAAIVATAIGMGFAIAFWQQPRVTADYIDDFWSDESMWVGMLLGVGSCSGYVAARAKSKGEKWGDVFLSNTDRVTKLLSDKEEWLITDKKMRKMLEKLGSIHPDYPGQCDHIRAGHPLWRSS